MTHKYKDAEVNGVRIEFTTKYGRVWARAPEITSQFIGAGNTKKEALADAIESLKVIQR